MIRITATLIPQGDEDRAQMLGSIDVINDETSQDPNLGNYDIALTTKSYKALGKLIGFKRLEQDVWSLLAAVLKTRLFLKTPTD